MFSEDGRPQFSLTDGLVSVPSLIGNRGNFLLDIGGTSGTFKRVNLRLQTDYALRVLLYLAQAGELTSVERMANAQLFSRVRGRDFETSMSSWQTSVPDAHGNASRLVYNPDNRAEAKLTQYLGYSPAPHYVSEVLPWPQRHDAIEGVAMLVNATSQGMVGQAALDLRLDKLPNAALVNDIIYIPRETPLIAAARARGNRTVTGLGMLLHQGIPAWKAWFGIEPKVTSELRRTIEATL